MRSTVWVVDPKRGRAGAEAIVAALAARGVTATLRELADGFAVVVENPPPDLALPEGVVRTGTVDLPGAEGMTRRGLLDAFAGTLVAVGAVGTAGIVASYASPPPARREDDVGEVEVARLSDLKAKGAVRFHLGREPCVLVHSEGRIVAMSLVCTHLGCLVEWRPERKQFVCPCHRAAFGIAGDVVEGPPPRPLMSLAVSVVGDRVLVRRRTAA